MRIFAVTGNGATAWTTARATFSSSGQSRSSEEPPFFAHDLVHRAAEIQVDEIRAASSP